MGRLEPFTYVYIAAAAAGPSAKIYKNTIPESTVNGVAALSVEDNESLPFKSASDRLVYFFHPFWFWVDRCVYKEFPITYLMILHQC